MKKTYSADELKTKANKVFEEYSNANKLYATVDGQVFLDQNRATLHAENKKRVFTFERPFVPVSEDEQEQTDETKDTPNAPDTVKAIKNVATLEELEQYASDNRKTVKKAYEARKKALEAAEDDTTTTTEDDDTSNGDNGTNTPENK